MKAAAQVGLFVVAAVVIFLIGVQVVGTNLFAPKSDEYHVAMPDAGGLAKGARVLMAGVQVGKVTKVGLSGPTQAELVIGLHPGTRLPLSTRAVVSASLVGLGDTPLNLVQDPIYHGPAGDFSPGATLPGGKAGPLDAILPNGGTDLYNELNETLRSVQGLLKNNGLQKDVGDVLKTTKATMETSQNTLRAFTALAQRGNGMLAQNQAAIASILRTTESTLVSVNSTAQSLEQYARSGHLQAGADRLIADAHQIAVQSQSLLTDIHRTLNDPQLNANLKATVANVAATTDKLPVLMDNANAIAQNVKTLTANSQELPGKLGGVLDGAKTLEDRLGGLADKVGGVLGKKPRSLPPIQTQVDLLRETNPGYWRTDLNLTVPITDGFITAGLWDAFERNRINLQYGTTVNSVLDYRYGVYAGRPGAGVDYRLAPKVGLRTDLWDINHPQLDARLRYDFGGGLNGWLGVDRIFDDPTFMFGIGVRR